MVLLYENTESKRGEFLVLADTHNSRLTLSEIERDLRWMKKKIEHTTYNAQTV